MLKPQKSIEINEDGFTPAVELIMAITDKDKNKAGKVLREFPTSKTWNERTWAEIEFKLEKQPGHPKKLVNLKQAIMMIKHLPGRIEFEDRLTMIRAVEQYIKENPKHNAPDVLTRPHAKPKPKYHQSPLCEIHKKSAYTCQGCTELFKNDPANHKCPRLICPLHLEQKHRCKGCNKTSRNIICKMHGKRKNVCPDCVELYKQAPRRYPCPSGICRDHFKRRTKCHCNDA